MLERLQRIVAIIAGSVAVIGSVLGLVIFIATSARASDLSAINLKVAEARVRHEGLSLIVEAQREELRWQSRQLLEIARHVHAPIIAREENP